VTLRFAQPDTCYANGVDASDGGVLVDALPAAAVVPSARAYKPDGKVVAQLRERSKPENRHRIREGFDASRLEVAGWAVIFAPGVNPGVKRSLAPLLERRRDEAGARYREYPDGQGDPGYRSGQSWHAFRDARGIGTGPADPRQMPYYVLIVGDPAELPYEFQHQLDVDRAVGRIHFDTPDEYARYARSVVDAEEGRTVRERRATFFSVEHPDDPSTELSHELLMTGLHTSVTAQLALPAGDPDKRLVAPWAPPAFVSPAEAGKARLARLLGGDETPAFLFTASHGAGFSAFDPEVQAANQGALVCGEYPGPAAWQGRGPMLPDHLFAAGDLDQAGSPAGLVALFFACYGAGTPSLNDFIHRRDLRQFEAKTLAPAPFVSPLARALLAHPNGGALAVVGHVDRAWSSGFSRSVAGPNGARAIIPDLAAFEDMLIALLNGQRVGRAVEAMNDRHASLSTDLTNLIDTARKLNAPLDAALAAELWTANNDARNYVVVGDPAVRLAVAPASLRARPPGE
jgi:hypothetical protein